MTVMGALTGADVAPKVDSTATCAPLFPPGLVAGRVWAVGAARGLLQREREGVK